MITIACVWTGDKYSFTYVERLKNMIDKYLKYDRFICLTDNKIQYDGIEMIKVKGLPGWWAKLALFNPDIRGDGRCIFFDLDTVIIDDLTPILQYEGPFAICRNFAKAKRPEYICNYGSCVMSFEHGFGREIYDQFIDKKKKFIRKCRYGDQQAIEQLYPNADYIQDFCPPGFFVGYREFTEQKPDGSIMIFAGKHKPDNSELDWVLQSWK